MHYMTHTPVIICNSKHQQDGAGSKAQTGNIERLITAQYSTRQGRQPGTVLALRPRS